MPIYDRRDKYKYNLLPVNKPRKTEYNPFQDPDFDISRMKENEFRQRDGTIIAKIPALEGRIHRRHDKDRNAKYVVLVADAYYDKDKGQMRNEKVIIGTALGGPYEGLMVANENYHEYFDRNGILVNDPLKRRKEKKAREEAEEQARKTEAERNQHAKEEEEQHTEREQQTRPELQTGSGQQTESANPTCLQYPTDEERTVDEIKASLLEQERVLKERLRKADEGLKEIADLREQLNNMLEARQYELEEKESAHLELLQDLVHDYQETVRTQAKRKPDAFMRATQIRTINRILEELRNYFAGSNAEDYLELAPEPREDDLENHPGTTYGEMDILLSAYANTIHAFRMGDLYYKE